MVASADVKDVQDMAIIPKRIKCLEPTYQF